LSLAVDIAGANSTNVIDVGARAAEIESNWWRLEGLAGYFGFEPDAAECARLNASRRGRETYVPLALGAQRGESAFFVTQKPACSSLYSPDEAVIARYPSLRGVTQTGQVNVTVVPLDDWWHKTGCPDVSFIKLDTQGSELDILRGGVSLLESCVGCEVEVEFSPIYKEQPLFTDVDRFMNKHGFTLWRLHGLCHYTERPGGRWKRSENVSYGGKNRRFPAGPGRLFWANAIYFRDYAGDFYREKRERLLVVAALLEACADHDGMRAALGRAARDGIVLTDSKWLRAAIGAGR
jgi:FkbM family methyltransferase